MSVLSSSTQGDARLRLYAVLWIAVLALASIRFFGPLHYDPNDVVPNGPETVKMGHELYKEGGWVNPYFVLKTGPSAHVAPLFPAFLAVLYHAFGDGAKGYYAFQFSEALILTADIGMIPLVAQALGAEAMVGFIAAFLAVLAMGRDWHLEGNLVTFMLLLVTLLACRYLRMVATPLETALKHLDKSRSLLQSPATLAAGIGLLWGLILLTSPSNGLVWMSWLALGWYSYRLGARRAWLLAMVVPILMIAPWTWRNYRVLHAVVPVRSNLGIELMVSNNPCAVYSLTGTEDNGCFWPIHPNISREEARKVIDLGEVQYNRLKMRQALDWIRVNPRAFWRLTRQRFLYFWFPTETGKLIEAVPDPRHHTSPWIVYSATLLSVPGLLLLWRTCRYGAVICMTFLAFYPVIYYFVAFQYRYRYPISWVTFVLGSVTIWRGALWAMDKLRTRDSRTRWLPSSAPSGSTGH